MGSKHQDWDFYFREMDGDPASIFLDLALVAKAPMQSRPYGAIVRLFMREPRADGLSSSKEHDRLIELENHLVATLSKSARALYAGRITCGGWRDFWFYVADPKPWKQRVARALEKFSEYEYSAGAKLDRRWKTYLELLYPSDENMERIQNRRVCDALQEDGDALTQPRDIDHWAYFPDASSRSRFLRSVTRKGFQVRELFEESDGSERPFVAHLFRVDVPSHDEIDAVTLPLSRAAQKVGGDYSGWETQLIKRPAKKTARSKRR